MMTIKVNMNEVMDLVRKIRAFDALPFNEMEFELDGKPYEVSEETRDDWKFSGLANRDFVVSVFEPDRFLFLVGIHDAGTE